MSGFIRRDVQRAETIAIHQNINKEVFDSFKDYCKEFGYPMNMVLEIFMQQYGNGRFKLTGEDILKFKNDGKETDTLNTTINKEIYLKFKSTCKYNGYFIRHIITAFMEKYASRSFILEYVDIAKTKE